MKDNIIHVDFKSKVVLRNTNKILVFLKSLKHKISTFFRLKRYTNSKLISFKNNKIS